MATATQRQPLVIISVSADGSDIYNLPPGYGHLFIDWDYIDDGKADPAGETEYIQHLLSILEPYRTDPTYRHTYKELRYERLKRVG